ncbi:MAG: ATP-binding cassette domain-containing protein [Clostridia bacterium]|nr:ATP-binding cassette domain-containing protein [Clostridia bacterium]
MITVEHICKTYQVARRNSGLSAAFSSLFHREYETIHALEDISFHIREGEIVGYIGPNGAGKSSTIKIMSGILVPDSGQCRINGMISWKQRREYVKDIGVVFGQRSQLWWDVPVEDSFELLKDIYRLSDQSYHRNLSYLIQLLDIGTIIRTPVRQLSLGQRMRCELAVSLLHSPRILFLDEPTIGLDAVSKIAVHNIIREINRDHGTTIILTTHDTQDIEALTNRILLIGKGRLLLNGDLQMLKKHYSSAKHISIDYTPFPRGGSASDLLNIQESGISVVKDIPGRLEVLADTSSISVSHVISILNSRLEINDLSITGTTMDEMVVSLYQEFSI